MQRSACMSRLRHTGWGCRPPLSAANACLPRTATSCCQCTACRALVQRRLACAPLGAQTMATRPACSRALRLGGGGRRPGVAHKCDGCLFFGTFCTAYCKLIPKCQGVCQGKGAQELRLPATSCEPLARTAERTDGAERRRRCVLLAAEGAPHCCTVLFLLLLFMTLLAAAQYFSPVWLILWQMRCQQSSAYKCKRA